MHPITLQAIAAEKTKDLRAHAAAERRARPVRRPRPSLRADRSALATRPQGSLN
jgi:hypothetical protein